MAITKYTTSAGTRWRAELYRGREKIARKGGFTRKKDAADWLREAEREATKPKPSGLMFSTMSSQYLEDCAARMQPNTVQEKFSHYKYLASFLGTDSVVHSITVPLAQEFAAKSQRTSGNKSANRLIRNLKALWNWHIRRGSITTNPWASVKSYPEDKHIKYIPPVEDIDAVRMAASPQENAFIDVLYFTAARLSEAMSLTWEDVNFHHQVITLWTRKRRGGNREPRTLAMAATLADTLRRLWTARDKNSPYVFTNPETGDKFHRNSHFVKHLFSRLCTRAGVKRFTAHAIRHHVASRLADEAKASLRQIQGFLGHQRQTTTETYVHDLTVDRSVASFLDAGTHQGTHGEKKGHKKTG